MKPAALYFLAGIGTAAVVIHLELSGFRRDLFRLVGDVWGKKP